MKLGIGKYIHLSLFLNPTLLFRTPVIQSIDDLSEVTDETSQPITDLNVSVEDSQVENEIPQIIDDFNDTNNMNETSQMKNEFAQVVDENTQPKNKTTLDMTRLKLFTIIFFSLVLFMRNVLKQAIKFIIYCVPHLRNG